MSSAWNAFKERRLQKYLSDTLTNIWYVIIFILAVGVSINQIINSDSIIEILPIVGFWTIIILGAIIFSKREPKTSRSEGFR